MLIFYTTAGCHLCEDAEAILKYCQSYRADIRWQSADIAEDEALVQQYGLRIPVIQSVATRAELGWPFDPGQVMAFVAAEIGTSPLTGGQ